MRLFLIMWKNKIDLIKQNACLKLVSTGNEYFARIPPKQVHPTPDHNAIEMFLNKANPNKRLIGEVSEPFQIQ